MVISTGCLKLVIDKRSLEPPIAKYSYDILPKLAQNYYISLFLSYRDPDINDWIDTNYNKENVIFNGATIESRGDIKGDIFITTNVIDAEFVLNKGIEVILLNPIFKGEVDPRIKVVKDWKELFIQIAKYEQSI